MFESQSVATTRDDPWPWSPANSSRLKLLYSVPHTQHAHLKRIDPNGACTPTKLLIATQLDQPQTIYYLNGSFHLLAISSGLQIWCPEFNGASHHSDLYPILAKFLSSNLFHFVSLTQGWNHQFCSIFVQNILINWQAFSPFLPKI